LRVDGHTCGAQGVDVAVDSALGNFETTRQVTGREVTVRVQQQQDAQQRVGAHNANI
jgi:hypothetical protein